MSFKLKQMAKTINELAKREEDARLSLCRAVANAMDMVREEGLKWTEWCDANLRKPDGTKWSRWTLYTYASYGRDPKKLLASREDIMLRSKAARDAFRRETRVAPRVTVGAAQSAIDHEVRALMFAWKAASKEAREIFLQRITQKAAA